MTRPQEPRRRARSAFTAAFLSLLFPGLGHAYAGAWYRALGFAAAAVPPPRPGAWASSPATGWTWSASSSSRRSSSRILLGNIVALLYRAIAAVDAYRVALYLNRWDEGAGRLGPSRSVLAPISVAGLLAVLLVMGGAHAAVAYYDLQALDLVQGVFNPDDEDGSHARTRPRASCPSPGASPEPAEVPLSTPPPGATAAPAEPAASPWDGTGRLNVLLIGSDRRPGEGSYNTDTLIVASVDPGSGQVAMFSIPRDTTGIPLNGTGALVLRDDLEPQDQRPLPAGARPAGHLPRRQAQRLRGPEGHAGRPLRRRHPVLRRGRLRRLHPGRRCAGRGNGQRAAPRRGRLLPRRQGRAPRLHPDGRPAHDGRPGARLRPLAARLDGLRPRGPPAARPPLPPPAGRLRDPPATAFRSW